MSQFTPNPEFDLVLELAGATDPPPLAAAH